VYSSKHECAVHPIGNWMAMDAMYIVYVYIHLQLYITTAQNADNADDILAPKLPLSVRRNCAHAVAVLCIRRSTNELIIVSNRAQTGSTVLFC